MQTAVCVYVNLKMPQNQFAILSAICRIRLWYGKKRVLHDFGADVVRFEPYKMNGSNLIAAELHVNC